MLLVGNKVAFNIRHYLFFVIYSYSVSCVDSKFAVPVSI